MPARDVPTAHPAGAADEVQQWIRLLIRGAEQEVERLPDQAGLRFAPLRRQPFKAAVLILGQEDLHARHPLCIPETRIHNKVVGYSLPFAASFVERAPVFAVCFVFAAPAFHASFAAFGPPVKNAFAERPKVSAPSFAVRPPVLAASLAVFLTLFPSPAALACGRGAASAASSATTTLSLRRSIHSHPSQRLAAEPLPHHVGRRGDLVLVGDEDRAGRGFEAGRPARPRGAGGRRAHGVGGSAGTRG